MVFHESDKTGHVLAFAALTFSGLLYFPKRFYIAFILTMLVFATGSEFLQATLRPKRHFSELDVYANILGVVITNVVWLTYYFIAGKRQSKKNGIKRPE